MTGRNDPCPCGSGKKFKKCCQGRASGHSTNTTNVRPASARLLDAVALHQAGHLDAAAQAYRAILASSPGDGDALHYLGVIAFQQHRYAESVDLIGQAIARTPGAPAFHCNLGNAYMRLRRFGDAKHAYRQACGLDPHFGIALVGLANACLSGGDAEEALAAARRGVEAAPQLFAAWVAFGDALHDTGHIDEAAESYRQALALHRDPGALTKLANILTRFGRVAEADECIAEALRIDAGFEPAWWARLMNLNYMSTDQQAICAAHRDWARRFVPHDTAAPTAPAVPRDHSRRLRIAYLSADFRRHALRFFVRPILRHHDRSRFEVHCYSNSAVEDDVTAELEALAEHWVDCHALSDAELADRIRVDGIDLLVDLSGHSQGNRLKALALKPAPVQVTMLGYLNTTGLKAIDYRIGDPFTCPPGVLDEYGTETLVRLPACQWCYEPDDEPAIAPLPARANGYVTFGCVHNLAKLTPTQLDLYARILAAVPASRLLMVVWGRAPRQDLECFFAGRGLAGRVELVEPGAYRDYLSLYDRFDVGLDAFPYSGGTTTLESVWMGVPVVTMKGPTQASNGGVSIMSNLGLPEFVADCPDACIDAARRIAADLDALATLRAGLRSRLRASPIMDGPAYVRALETLYRGFVTRAQPAQS